MTRIHIVRGLVAAAAGAALTSVGVAGAASATPQDPAAGAAARSSSAADWGRYGTAYVVNTNSDTVTPIRTATNTTGDPIATGTYPVAIAITPNGRTAYVTNEASDTVTRIRTAT